MPDVYCDGGELSNDTFVIRGIGPQEVWKLLQECPKLGEWALGGEDSRSWDVTSKKPVVDSDLRCFMVESTKPLFGLVKGTWQFVESSRQNRTLSIVVSLVLGADSMLTTKRICLEDYGVRYRQDYALTATGKEAPYGTVVNRHVHAFENRCLLAAPPPARPTAR